MNNPRQQHGFALLLTLVLVMIAAIALTAIARQSTTEALACKESTEALQRRWAVTSCRSTLLPRAQRLLARDGQRDPHVWVSCELSGQRYDLVLSDEQAKYNPTVMQGYAERSGVAASLRQFAEAGGLGAASGRSVELRPLIDLEIDGSEFEPMPGSTRRSERYAGYGQLFAGVAPGALVGREGRTGPAVYTTCWGDGKLNLRRSPDVVVREALEPVLGRAGVEQLLTAREEMPGRDASVWLGRAVPDDPRGRAAARHLLAEESRCQGLWVIARGPTRSWYTLSILEYQPGAREQADESARGTDPGGLNPIGDADEETQGALRRYDYAW